MKKFMLVMLVVLCSIGILAACAPLPTNLDDGAAYAKALPEWVIIIGAIVIFLIGFTIIWKLLGGFIKFIVILALGLILAGVAIGIWPKAEIENTVDDLIDKTVDGIEGLTDGNPLDDLGITTESPEVSE
jgi:hypothetical protein